MSKNHFEHFNLYISIITTKYQDYGMPFKLTKDHVQYKEDVLEI